MSDEEIKQHLIDHQFQISASDGILDIFKGVKQGIPLASADGRNGEIINKTENI